jgi:hypothetical protein
MDHRHLLAAVLTITITIAVGLLGLQADHPLVPQVALALVLVELAVVLVLAVVTPEDQEVAQVVRRAHQVEVTQEDQKVVEAQEEQQAIQALDNLELTEAELAIRLQAMQELALLGELQIIQQQHLEENQKIQETPEVVVVSQKASKKK